MTTVAFDLNGRFYDQTTSVEYEGKILMVDNGLKGKTHMAKVTCDEHTEAEQRSSFRSISHFLNELAWDYQLGVKVLYCSEMPIEGKSTRNHETLIAIHNFQQQVKNEQAHLALGCYREALDTSSPFYKFLSYYRAIEAALPNGIKRGDWIEKRIPELIDSKHSVDKLSRAGITNIGKWLRDNGRHALAHGRKQRGEIVGDICDFDDWQDIVWAKDIVKELARESIIENFMINRPRYA